MDNTQQVKDQLAAGVAESTIRDTLERQGYDTAEIDRVLEAARSDVSASPGQEEVPGPGVAPGSAPGADVGALPPVGEFFMGSWRFVTERIDVLAYLALALFLFGWMPFVGPIVSILVAAIALYVALRPNTQFSEVLAWMQENFVSYLWVAILVWLVLMTGFVLLVIPGLILGSYLVLALSLRIEQGTKGLDALVKSTQMIYGVWWGTFGRMFLLVFSVSFAVGIVVGILQPMIGYSEDAAAEALFYWPEAISLALNALIAMVTMAGAARIYEARKHVTIEREGVPAQSTLRTLYTVFAWLGIAASIVLMYVIAFVITVSEMWPEATVGM